jgi:hypothetical protein
MGENRFIVGFIGFNRLSAFSRLLIAHAPDIHVQALFLALFSEVGEETLKAWLVFIGP